ncbi:MAG: HAMP domain-containing protein, partial [Solirubrobacterales bacterium]
MVVASVIGYLLAGAGLAPVEAMRRRARDVSLTRSGERLPLPIAHDEIRRLGETLNEMLVRLHRSFERERDFVADASHELRTPIAVI